MRTGKYSFTKKSTAYEMAARNQLERNYVTVALIAVVGTKERW